MLSWNFFQRSQKIYGDHDLIGSILWQPSAEVRVEHQKLNQTAPLRRRLVEFLVFNSIYLKKSVSPDAEKVVRRRLVEFLVFNSIYFKKVVRNPPENRIVTQLNNAFHLYVELLVSNPAFGDK